MRKFEKISFEQFKKDISDDKELYESYLLPKRSTKNSAGYDIASLEGYTLKPGEAHIFVTGLKVSMNSDEVLYLYGRSSNFKKKGLMLANNVGVVDSDYYGNEETDGHIMFSVINFRDEDVLIKKGEVVGQGVFSKYLLVDDDNAQGKRTGGFGSTDKK